MTFTEHLGELRTRLIRSAIAIAVAVVVCYAASNTILDYLTRPLRPLADAGLIATNAPQTPGEPSAAGETPPVAVETPEAPPAVSEAPTIWDTIGAALAGSSGKSDAEKKPPPEWVVLNPLEGMMTQFKVAGYGGVVLALPYILLQICAFVFPGLKPGERRIATILVVGSSVLATAGVAVAYFGVLPLILPYLIEFGPDFYTTQLRLSETLTLIIRGLLGFGIAFQFPMVVLVLVYLGLLTPQTLQSYRRVAIVGMAVVSAVLTPPDPFSLLVMLFPLWLLYELSILLSYLVTRRKQAAATEG